MILMPRSSSINRRTKTSVRD